MSPDCIRVPIEPRDVLARGRTGVCAGPVMPVGGARIGSDAVSDLLKSVRLTGAIFFQVAATPPWVAEQPPKRQIIDRIRPEAEHLIAFHVITQGRCYANIIGDEPIALDPGEIVIFPHGSPHVVSSSPGLRARPGTPHALDGAGDRPLPFLLDYGGDGPDAAKFVCGFLVCDARPFNPLIERLPPVIRAGKPGGDEQGWLGQFIRMTLVESASPHAGGDGVLARMSELMFVEVIRRYLEALPPEDAGWVAGLRDRFVGRALSLMHAAPAHRWTIETLARQVGLSRSILAERFTALVGVPPMHYLAKWRMQVAWGLLSADTNIANVAEEIGYGSEAAFSRAFKKIVGMPPSQWRRRGGSSAAV